MVKITFVEFDKTEHLVEAEEGQTIMEAAVAAGVPGIDADCGGACACATCHVYIEPGHDDKLGEPESVEIDMLEFAVNPDSCSRLSCQLVITSEFDGLVIRLPESQR